MLVIIVLSAFLFAYGLALPTDSGSASADCLGKIFYAQFSGTVCGIFVFKDVGGTVSVETLGDGISGLDVSLGTFPYHSTFPLKSMNSELWLMIVHNEAVVGGVCDSTGEHFNPYNVPDSYVCTSGEPEKCKVSISSNFLQSLP